MSKLYLPCEGNPQWGQQIEDTPFFRRCDCPPYWHASICVAAVGPAGRLFACGTYPRTANATDYGFTGDVFCALGGLTYTTDTCYYIDDFDYADGDCTHPLEPLFFAKKYGIKSVGEDGSTISLPVAIAYGYGTGGFGGAADLSATTSHSLTVTVGRDTGGSWRPLEEWTENGVTFRAYINSFRPESATAYSYVPGYGVPYEGYDGTTYATPGKIKWNDILPIIYADGMGGLGPMVVPVTYDYWFNSLQSVGGTKTLMGASALSYCADAAGTLTLATNPPVAPCKVEFSGLWPYPKAVYTSPGDCTTDDLLTLGVTYINPFTGLVVDGTHAFGDSPAPDGTQPDVDFVPRAVMSALLHPDEVVTRSLITRNAYGDYTMNDIRFKAKKGIRRINVYADFAYGSMSPSPVLYPVTSDAFVLSAGIPAYVDLIPQDLSFTHEKWQIGETLLRGGTDPLTARILDALGFAEPFNVVDGATNTAVLTIINGSSNSITTPTLAGTTSQAAVDGIASFDDLTAHALGKHYTLRVSSSGLGQSHNENWYEFPAEFWIGLRFQTPGTINAGIATTIYVDLVDASGTIVTPDLNTDALTLSGAGSFSGFGNATPVSGTASWTGSFPAAGTYMIQVVTSGTHYDGPPTTVTLAVVVSP